MTVASSPWVRGDASSSYGSRYRSYSADLKGIHWAPAVDAEIPGHLANYDPANSKDTIYEPLSGLLDTDVGTICLPTTFDISKEEFQAAAVLDLSQFFPEPDDNTDNTDNTETANDPLYALVGSIEAEGYASGVDQEGYADSFWTDEAEIYFGLYNDKDGDGFEEDELVGAVQVEVDLRRKVDILFAGGSETGLAEAGAFLAALTDANIKKFIKKIEISYASFGDPVDPLVAEIGAFATEIGGAIPSNLASLIEIEAGNPHASSWAKNVFPALLAHSCECGDG